MNKWRIALLMTNTLHDDVIKWNHFPRYWPFVPGIHRSPVNSPHKGQWRGALMFSLIRAWIKDWVNNREAGDLRRHRVHYDVTVMIRNKPYIILYIMALYLNNHFTEQYFKTTIMKLSIPTHGALHQHHTFSQDSCFSQRRSEHLNIRLFSLLSIIDFLTRGVDYGAVILKAFIVYIWPWSAGVVSTGGNQALLS